MRLVSRGVRFPGPEKGVTERRLISKLDNNKLGDVKFGPSTTYSTLTVCKGCVIELYDIRAGRDALVASATLADVPGEGNDVILEIKLVQKVLLNLPPEPPKNTIPPPAKNQEPPASEKIELQSSATQEVAGTPDSDNVGATGDAGPAGEPEKCDDPAIEPTAPASKTPTAAEIIANLKAKRAAK